MTTILPPFQNYLVRAAANLPQTATGNLFTIGGGPVCGLVLGRVTTGLGASASVVRLINTPTLGAASDLSLAAGTSLTGFVAGRWAWFAGPNAALQVSPGAAADEPAMVAAGGTPSAFGFILAPGTIALVASGNQTGQMEWHFFWQPMRGDLTTTVVAV